MVNIEEARELIRNKFPKLKIVSSFLFRGKYFFRLINEEYINSDYTYIEVLGDGKIVLADMKEVFDNVDEFVKAQDSADQTIIEP